jgi:hypothetical protein
MRYALYYNRNGDRKFILFSVAFMQFIASMSTEFYSVWVICNEKNPINAFINLLAFVFICNIEDAMSGSLQNNLAKGLLSEGVTLNF